MKIITCILLIEKYDTIGYQQMYGEFCEKDFLGKVLLKRIEVFKLPRLEPSAIMILSVLCDGNPGRAVLGLIETLEKAEEIKPEKIDGEFICEHVYPFGFYDEFEFDKIFEDRRAEHSKGYNRII